MALRALDSLDVGVADREAEAQGVVRVDIDRGIETARVVPLYHGLARTEAVPEVHEGVGEIERVGSGDAQMGVAPLAGVEAANVVAADEAELIVDDQQFTV